MKFNTSIRITFNDLSFEKQEEIRNAIAEFVKEDKDLMEQIREEETEEWNEAGADLQKKIPLERYIELRIDEVAMKNENSFKEYLELEFDIQL